MSNVLPGLEELTRKYVQELPRRMNDIAGQWQQLKHVNWDRKVLTGMIESAHKLTGSGAVYGFSDISASANELESLLVQVDAQPNATAAHRTQIDNAIAALASAIEQAVSPESTPLSSAMGNDTTWTERNTTDLPARIAVIDDDPDQANLLGNWLTTLGYQPSLFSHPKEYMQSCQQQPFDVVLMDICYPEGTLEGLIWLENLQSQLGSQTPIIMMSARTDMVARMRALRAGAAAFFTKPLELDALKERIAQLLQRSTAQPPRVMWIDDDALTLDVYKRVLSSEGFDVDTVTQPLTLMQRLETFHPDVIILDYMMPGVNGLEVARVLRQDPRYLLIPIVFLSASPQAMQNQSQLSLVGNAFLTKPIDQQTLIDCLRQQINRSQLVTQRVKQISKRFSQDKLSHQQAFFALLERTLSELATSKKPRHYALVQLEIDQEEYLRSTQGVRALLNTTAAIEQFLAEPDLLGSAGCSLGGSAFLGLVSAPTADAMEQRVTHLFEAVQKQQWPATALTEFTLSAGVVILRTSTHLDELLKEAEDACAHAMESGGNRLYWHKVALTGPSHNTSALLKALENRSFKLLFQPIVNLETGECLYESIVHAEDDQGKLYPPRAFMQWVESGSVVDPYEVDRWTLQNAVARLEKLAGEQGASAAVVIPILSGGAQAQRLVPLIGNLLSNARIKGARRIYLKFSDEQLLEDIKGFAAVLAKLVNLGCTIMLEEHKQSKHISALIKDVGSVSLIRLSARQLRTKADKNALERFMLECGGSNAGSIQFIATVVETAADVAAYWELGIRYFQGFFVQEPGTEMNYNHA